MTEAPTPAEYSREFSRDFDTPAGPVTARATDIGIIQLRFRETPARHRDSHPHLDALAGWLARYATDPRTPLDLPLAPRGTAFERTVWDALVTIPAGETRSYADIAKAIGKPKASRAVGRANGANPVAILIPCHRVIASDGSLHGYAGGLDIKLRLLAHEGALDPLFEHTASSVRA